jgi:hypothetical protein
MNEQDCDRIIDAAAARMVAGEPGRTLTGAVMTMVGQPTAPAPRPLIWVTAAASVVLCGAIAIAVMNRVPAIRKPAPIPARPAAVQFPSATTPPVVVSREAVPEPLPAAARVASQPSAAMPVLPDYPSAVRPLETEPIAL